MRQFQGKDIVVGVGNEKIKGTLIADFPDHIVLATNQKDGGGCITSTIFKDKISFFVVAEEKNVAELEKVGSMASGIPLTIIACDNKKMNCPGVKLVINKFEKDITKEDFHAFMKDCPMCQKTCRTGSYGNVYKTDPRALTALLNGTMFGEYPTKK